MRPAGAGRSDLLLKVGPWKVAARLSLGETIEDGEPVESVEVGDMGSGTAAAKHCKLGQVLHRRIPLTGRGCCNANMIGQVEDVDIGGTRRAFYGGKSAHAVHVDGVPRAGSKEESRGRPCQVWFGLKWSTSSGCSFAAILKVGDMDGSEVCGHLVRTDAGADIQSWTGRAV